MARTASEFWLAAMIALSTGLVRGQQTAAPNRPSEGATNSAARAAIGEPDPATTDRRKFWNRDFSSAAAYEKSIAPNRERLCRVLGAIDPRVSPAAIESADTNQLAPMEGLRCERARWPVFEGVWAEGLRLRPKTPPLACVIVLPDADQTPETLAGLAPGLLPERQFARRLAEQGCEVLVPVLLDRSAVPTSGGNPAGSRSLSRRDRLCQEAIPLGRHLLGYEVQKVLAAVDGLLATAATNAGSPVKIGLAGYGEGGLVAFYSAALDRRIAATLVSGCFDSPHPPADAALARTLFGFQREFGDAEIATLIAPRGLTIEYSLPPGAAPDAPVAAATAPDYESVEAEFDRARALLKPGDAKGLVRLTLISGTEGMATGPGSDRALVALLKDLGMNLEQLKPASVPPPASADPSFLADRQQRQFDQLEQFTRQLREKIERNR